MIFALMQVPISTFQTLYFRADVSLTNCCVCRCIADNTLQCLFSKTKIHMLQQLPGPSHPAVRRKYCCREPIHGVVVAPTTGDMRNATGPGMECTVTCTQKGTEAA